MRKRKKVTRVYLQVIVSIGKKIRIAALISARLGQERETYHDPSCNASEVDDVWCPLQTLFLFRLRKKPSWSHHGLPGICPMAVS